MQRFEHYLDSEIEYGLRALIIISIMDKCELSFEKILIFDYMMTDINDFDVTMESVHPKTSYRYAKLFVKRQVYKKGLTYCISKNLIDIQYTTEGIIYRKTSLTDIFLEYLEVPYVDKLKYCTYKINKLYGAVSLTDLQILIDKKVKEHGIEFRVIEV